MHREITVALFSPLYPPFRGGAATDADLLAPELAEFVSLFLVTERAAGYQRIEKRRVNSGRHFTILRILPRYSSTEAKHLYKPFLLTFNRLALLLVVLKMRICYGVKLFHFHGQYARFGVAYLLAALIRVTRARMLLDIRDKGVNGGKLRLFDMVIAASLSVADNIRNNTIPSKFSMVAIPHAAPTAHAISKIVLPEQFFLFVGTVRQLKGVDTLVEAYRRYRAEGGRVPLLLLGPIVDVSLTRCPGVLTLGPCDPPFVFDTIRRCELLLLPSRSEGLPHVCLEAIDAGARFVVGPGVPEMERFCPQNVLSDTTPEVILQCFKKPESIPTATGYDLAPHRPNEVAKALFKIYRKLLKT